MHSALPWRMPFLNLRSHRKILCVDGRIAFTGGLNIGDENVIAGNPHHPVLDTHFRVDGPVVAQLCEAFAGQWYFTTGETLAGPGWIKTPYFLPDDRIITALALAAMRNVVVDIVLPAHSNHPTVDWAMRAHIGPLLVAGCRVWTHAPPFDHSKLLAVDNVWCFVGSTNWDMRSFRLNFEVNVEVYQSDLVGQVSAKIVANQTTRLTAADLEEHSLASRLRNNAAHLMLPYL
jgi:cardiolipin synthase